MKSVKECPGCTERTIADAYKRDMSSLRWALTVGAYLALSVIALLLGAIGADNRYSGCASTNKIENLFPAYRLACWAFKSEEYK